MDGAGNIYYTKAGMLTYDSNGYLVDINGSFVLGAATATSDPDSQKIKLDDIGSVDASLPTCEMTVNGITYTITGSNATTYGNCSITMSSSQALPSGLKATAAISATGSISVTLNAYEEFGSMDELNAAVNAAIKEANGGVEHAAGSFTITASENVFGSDATSASISGAVINTDPILTVEDTFFNGKFSVTSFEPEVPVSSAVASYSVAETNLGDSSSYTITVTVDGIDYTGIVIPNGNTDLTLSSAGGGTIELALANGEYIKSEDILNETTSGTKYNIAVTEAKKFLGGAAISAVSSTCLINGSFTFDSFQMNGTGVDVTFNVSGTVFTGTIPSSGGAVSFTSPTGDYISMVFPTIAEMKENLNLSSDVSDADFITALTTSSSYNSLYLNAAAPAVSESLTGAQIVGTAGGIDYGSITGTAATNGLFGGIMTIKGVSSTFDGQGTISGDAFTATYSSGSDDEEASWILSMTVGGKTYTGTLKDGEQASSLLLKSDAGDYVEVSNPGFSALKTAYESSGGAAVDGSVFQAFGATDGSLTITPSVASSNLGLGTSSMVLTGGTEGGPVTLDQITNISIGSDGTIAVSHSDLGTVVAGKISLAVFANSSGLQLMGTNYYSETANSGSAILVDPGAGGSGSLTSSAVEMSNVDISNEFAEMITCQRGFQANSRIITVTDTMIEELINLKR